MNKLESLYREAANRSWVQQKYEEPYLSEDLFIDEVKEINIDVAIKFAHWMKHQDTIESAEKYFGFSDLDMFNEFINNHYEN